MLARLQAIGAWAVPGSTMQLFGSSACELHAHGADLDVTLLPVSRPPRGPPSYVEQQLLVRHLAATFQPFQGEFTLVQAVEGARVPILRLQHAASGLRCDLSIGNHLAVQKTRLLHAYVQLDPRVRPLCLIVKHCAPPRAATCPHARKTMRRQPKASCQHQRCMKSFISLASRKHLAVLCTGASSRDLAFRVERASSGVVTFHGALNSYAWVHAPQLHILTMHSVSSWRAHSCPPQLLSNAASRLGRCSS